MKNLIFICSIVLFLVCSAVTHAQDSTRVQTKKKFRYSLELGSRGVQVKPYDTAEHTKNNTMEQMKIRFFISWFLKFIKKRQ